MRTILINLFFMLLLSMAGCSIYKVDIQQGNVIDPEKLAQLKTGMNKKQVVFLIGNPLLTDPFHQNRWDYIHAVKPGGEKLSRKVLTLYFDGDKLIRIDDSHYQKMETINN